MTKTNLGSLPEDMKPLVGGLMDKLRRDLTAREYVQPVWFLVSRKDELLMPVVIPFSDEDEKRMAGEFIRTLVKDQQPKADAVIFMCEAWKKEYKRDEDGFYDRTTPVSKRTGREDIIMVMVETYDGLWVAEPVVTGEPGEKRKLADIEFKYMDAVEGTMSSYLPPRNKNEVN